MKHCYITIIHYRLRNKILPTVRHRMPQTHHIIIEFFFKKNPIVLTKVIRKYKRNLNRLLRNLNKTN